MILSVGNTALSVNGNILARGNTPTPPGPPVLPPYTMMLLFQDGATPKFRHGGTGTQVSVSPNVWLFTNKTTDWSWVFDDENKLLEVIDANTTGITNMYGLFFSCNGLRNVSRFDTSSVINMRDMFNGCTELESVPLFDTSNVLTTQGMLANCDSLITVPKFNLSNCTSMRSMFLYCDRLETIPLFDTSKVTTFLWMCEYCASLKEIPLFDVSSCTELEGAFKDCTKVERGILDFYNRAKHITSHQSCFENCGIDTVTGAAELAQIPSDWK